MQKLRLLFQICIILLALATGYRFMTGSSMTSIETYCPFGGLEAMASLLTQRQFTCTTGERNLTIFIALILLTLFSRKAFCGWICPIGSISEWIYLAIKKLNPLKKPAATPAYALLVPISRSLHQRLGWIRWVVLGVILVLTYRTGELIFRGYDPYYILFSFHGHDVHYFSYVVLAAVIIGIVVVPMAWCRYLCPLGAVLWPVAACSRIRIARNESECIHCGICDQACPQSIEIASCREVKSGECTLCYRCMDRCPKEDCLELRMR